MADILYGLDVSEFRHPADIAALKIVEKTIVLNKLGGLLEKKESFYHDEIDYAGSAILLTEKNAPDVVGVLHRAMETLDFESDVRLYCNRYLSLIPAFSKTNRCYICIPEIALRLLSKAQLQFLFGRCITAFKGNMTKLFTLSNYIGTSEGDLLAALPGSRRSACLSGL